MNRQCKNEEILRFLNKIVENYPDLRFGQMLNNLGIVSDTRLFYEEPSDTMKTIKMYYNMYYNKRNNDEQK